MDRGSAGRALREIRTLFGAGRPGGMTDGELIDRFLGRDGPDREDAFAALVHRHGPMVLGVCRRMLRNTPDADPDDAFQAVFLVLARRAGSVRDPARLKPWLYGVAVKAAREARRNAARRRAREGGAMVEPPAGPEPRPGDAELLALLDEEIGRLPARFGVPLILCELEGLPRREAAERLGLAEGTLSSRLARGRTMLRDRLVRRGVASASAALALAGGSGVAAPTDGLVDSTARLALGFASGGSAAGAVPAAVAALAEGVLAMLAASKLKLMLVSGSALAFAALAAGLTWAVAPASPTPPTEPSPPASVADEEPASPPRRDIIRGVVVDEDGRPVAGAEVLAAAFTDREARGLSGDDGTFAIPIRRGVSITTLLARSGDGRLGHTLTGLNLAAEAAEPIRLVLRPARAVEVRVADAEGAAVPGATVDAVGEFDVLTSVATGPDGVARLDLPADGKVQWVLALKPGRGFDYAELRATGEAGRKDAAAPNAEQASSIGIFEVTAVDEQGRAVPVELRTPAAADEMPASIKLTLGETRTARIKAVDADGNALAGVGFRPWLLRKPGRSGEINYDGRATVATTGPDGIATFDWLPAGEDLLQFWPVGEGYASRRVIVEPGQEGPVVARPVRSVPIRGRVVLPDGSPAEGILVRAYGTGKGLDHGQASSPTDAEGSYQLDVSPGEAYAVWVDNQDWAAPSRLDVIVREGQPVEGVDFRLALGTIIRGTVTVGPDGKPAADEYIRLDESGDRPPNEFREEGDRTYRVVNRQWGVPTDSEGRYTLRVGPGTYTLVGPARTENQTIVVGDEPEIVRDFQMPRPEKGPIAGRVVLASDPEASVAGARVEIVAANMRAIRVATTADAEGRFRAERHLDPLTIHARNEDGSLGAIVEVGADDAEVVIPLAPTASAVGVLLDESGEPAANQKVEWGRRVYLDPERRVSTTCFAPKVATDAEGRFALPSLVVGQEYGIALERDGVYHAAGAVKPEGPGTIDLGTIRAGSYRPGLPAGATNESSFRDDAPGPGDPAPKLEATTLDGQPLALADFQGKYVLLDFWATWCGPCIKEIPKVQAVHDAFGDDDRLAILSVSVDESIDEPRAFHEARKLPWSQAFLAGGLHGPTPGAFGVEAIPAFVLVGPDGAIVDRGMRGDDIKEAVARALGAEP